MFTKPVRTMLLITAALLVLVFYEVDDKQPGTVEVPDLAGMADKMN